MTDIKLWLGNSLNLLSEIEDNSIALTLVPSLPHHQYGTSYNVDDIDKVYPIDSLMDGYLRVTSEYGAVVLFMDQPYSSELVTKFKDKFRYDWIVDYQNLLESEIFIDRKQPAHRYEQVLVFSNNMPRFYPQYQENTEANPEDPCITKFPTNVLDGFRLSFHSHLHERDRGMTPVDLLAYLIDTYTVEGTTVLDNFAGYANTALACVQTKRNFIGIEPDKKLALIAKERLTAASNGTVFVSFEDKRTEDELNGDEKL